MARIGRLACEEREARARIEQAWDSLAHSAVRLDEGSGPVELVEIADYQCPYCQTNHALIVEFMAENPDVGIAYLHFPLPGHTAAPGAAKAAICAEPHGRFREVHNGLYESLDWAEDEDWMRVAVKAGVPDTTRFRACLTSPATEERLAKHIALATELGVQGTPSFVHLSGLHTGVADKELLREWASGVR